MSSNPGPALDAIVAPSPITLAHICILERIGSPLLSKRQVRISEAVPGVYLLSMPPAEAVQHLATVDADSLAWVGTLSPAEWRKRLHEVDEGLTAFFAMMPQPEYGAEKKSTPTAGLQS